MKKHFEENKDLRIAQRHFDSFELIQRSSKENIRCQYCNKKMSSKHLSQHLRKVHFYEDSTETGVGIPRPRPTEKQEGTKKAPVKLQMPCENWDKKFTSMTDLIMHIEQHEISDRASKAKSVIADKQKRKYGNRYIGPYCYKYSPADNIKTDEDVLEIKKQ